MQYSFTCNVRHMTTDTIFNNPDVYDDAMKEEKENNATTASSTNTPEKLHKLAADKANKAMSTALDDPNAAMDTPPPKKKPSIDER